MSDDKVIDEVPEVEANAVETEQSTEEPPKETESATEHVQEGITDDEKQQNEEAPPPKPAGEEIEGNIISEKGEDDTEKALPTAEGLVKELKASEEKVLESVEELPSVRTSADDVVSELMLEIFKETTKEKFDREGHVVMYRELIKERISIDFKNALLHRKFAEYYRKKKAFEFLKDIKNPPGVDLEQNYKDQLMLYDAIKKSSAEQKEQFSEDLSKKQAMEDECYFEFSKKFDGLQKLELAAGTGLKFAANGQIMPKEVAEKYLLRQKNKLGELSYVRLNFIKFRDLVKEQEARLEEIEKLGEGLQVGEYENLKSDYQYYVKKIGERDERINRHRNVCSRYLQMLAHIKEELYAEDERYKETNVKLRKVEAGYNQAREELGAIKKCRMGILMNIQKELSDSELLAHQRLLLDYEKSQKIITSLHEKKKDLENELKDISTQRLALVKTKVDQRLSNPVYNLSDSKKIRPRLHLPAKLSSQSNYSLNK